MSDRGRKSDVKYLRFIEKHTHPHIGYLIDCWQFNIKTICAVIIM